MVGIIATGALLVTTAACSPVRHDPPLAASWPVNAIELPASPDLTAPPGAVRLAVVDTGIESVGPVTTLLTEGVQCDPTCVPAPPGDGDGHGTEVASIVAEVLRQAGATDPSATSVVGVRAADARGTLTVDGVAEGIRWAGVNDIRVAVVSLVAADSDALTAAIESDPNLLVVVPAGNDGLDVDRGAAGVHPCTNPAPNVLCVAASGPDTRLVDESNFGATSVDLAAPGQRLVTTTTGGRRVWVSGTSYAAALVGAAAALAAAATPDASAAHLAAALRCSAVHTGGRNATVSGGVLSVRGTLDALAPGGCADPAGLTPPVD